MSVTYINLRINMHTRTPTVTLQKNFKQILDKYKKARADDKVLLPRNFFENKCKIEPMCFNLEVDEDLGLDAPAQTNATLDAMKMDVEKGTGKPFNFRPTFREKLATERKRAQAEQAERERVRAAEVDAAAAPEALGPYAGSIPVGARLNVSLPFDLRTCASTRFEGGVLYCTMSPDATPPEGFPELHHDPREVLLRHQAAIAANHRGFWFRERGTDRVVIAFHAHIERSRRPT